MTDRLPDQPPVPGGTTAIRDGKYVREERAPGPPVMNDRLSPQELRVMVLLANGHTIDTAAIEMDISSQTVKNHAGSAYKKLRVKNRYGAFLELGWLTPPGMRA